MTRFPMMWLPLSLFAVKEMSVGITSLLVIREYGIVAGAAWHGKATTAFLYIMMLIHLIWFNIPNAVSTVTIVICFAMMVVVVGVVLFATLMNLSAVLCFAERVLGLILPVIIGGILALFLNVPMAGIEKRLRRMLEKRERKHSDELSL